jgi:hypothetical protein
VIAGPWPAARPGLRATTSRGTLKDPWQAQLANGRQQLRLGALRLLALPASGRPTVAPSIQTYGSRTRCAIRPAIAPAFGSSAHISIVVSAVVLIAVYSFFLVQTRSETQE